MTRERDLDRLLGSFFAAGADELPDRVIDAALDEIDHTPQRHVLHLPRRFHTMPMLTRVAAAAVVGVIAIGGALYVTRSGESKVGEPNPVPSADASASGPVSTLAPTRPPRPTPKPSAMALSGAIGAGRQIHTATLLADGRVLVAGGFDFADLPLASATLFDPTTVTFQPTGSLAAARGLDTATLLADGRVLFTGGGPASWVHPGPYHASAELYDPRTGNFSPTGSMATAREGHTATLLGDGHVLVTGGMDVRNHTVASAELYNPKTGTFSPTGSMTTARAFHTATLLADGRVLVAGGVPDGWATSHFLNSAEIYDPTTGTFSPTGSMTTARSWHTATLLSDGRVLIAGGGGDKSAELYDPQTGTFTATGPMMDAREYHTATILADGRVLVVGGGGDYTDRRFLASAEVYDPTAGTFSSTGAMAAARTYHTATLLVDGRVLVAGGYGDLAPLASAELYDPKSGTFSPAGAGG